MHVAVQQLYTTHSNTVQYIKYQAKNNYLLEEKDMIVLFLASRF